jgi:hypothetical protein
MPDLLLLVMGILMIILGGYNCDDMFGIVVGALGIWCVYGGMT